jgi:hypothetical protein
MSPNDLVTKQDLLELEQRILDALKSNKEAIPVNKEWLKSKEVRELLKISPGTLQNIRISGKLPYTKIGGITFYSREDVNSLLMRNKKGQV